ncbi:MAG: hypothetical protein QXJ40_02545, partial [Candidatus Bathyarchaeia archaeon]
MKIAITVASTTPISGRTDSIRPSPKTTEIDRKTIAPIITSMKIDVMKLRTVFPDNFLHILCLL